MFPSALLAAALAVAAPVPKPVPPGPVPYLLSLSIADGKVIVGVSHTDKVVVRVPLADLKDLKITTAAGKEVKAEDAVKKIIDGGAVVVASADGKPVDAKYLKLFKDDVLVLVSPQLATKPGGDDLIDGTEIPEPRPPVPPPFVFPGSDPPKKEK